MQIIKYCNLAFHKFAIILLYTTIINDRKFCILLFVNVCCLQILLFTYCNFRQYRYLKIMPIKLFTTQQSPLSLSVCLSLSVSVSLSVSLCLSLSLSLSLCLSLSLSLSLSLPLYFFIIVIIIIIIVNYKEHKPGTRPECFSAIKQHAETTNHDIHPKYV